MNIRKIAIAVLAVAIVAPSLASIAIKDKKEKKPKTEKVDKKKPQYAQQKGQRKVETISDVEAAIQGIEKIVTHTLADVEPIVAQICESQQTKKSVCPRIYVGAANAFWLKSGVSDTTYALKYLDHAIQLAPHYAPAYMLKGDIYKWADDTTTAVMWYKKAMEMAPHDFSTYRKYAAFVESGSSKENRLSVIFDRAIHEKNESDLAEVRNRMEKLMYIYKTAKDVNPTFPYELECARLYANYHLNTNETNKGIKFYDSASPDSLDASDYAQRARMLYEFTYDADGSMKFNLYNRIIEVCDSGLMRFPTDYNILSGGLVYLIKAYDLVKKQRNGGEALAEYKNTFSTKALGYGERLMATKDTLIKNEDIYRYGIALIYRYKQQQGIDVLKELISKPTVTDGQVSDAMNAICEAYRDLGEYEKAEYAYEDLIKTLDAKGSLQEGHFQNYAKMLEAQAEESFGQEMIDTYKKACKVYERGAERFPNGAPLFYYFELQLCKNEVLDPEGTYELAIVPAKKIFNLLGGKAKYVDNEEVILGASLSPLVNYYLKKKDYMAMKPYLLKWHQLEPDNEQISNLLRTRCKVKI